MKVTFNEGLRPSTVLDIIKSVNFIIAHSTHLAMKRTWHLKRLLIL